MRWDHATRAGRHRIVRGNWIKLSCAMAYKPPVHLSQTFLDRPAPDWKGLTLQVSNAVKAVDAAVRGLR